MYGVCVGSAAIFSINMSKIIGKFTLNNIGKCVLEAGL